MATFRFPVVRLVTKRNKVSVSASSLIEAREKFMEHPEDYVQHGWSDKEVEYHTEGPAEKLWSIRLENTAGVQDEYSFWAPATASSDETADMFLAGHKGMKLIKIEEY